MTLYILDFDFRAIDCHKLAGLASYARHQKLRHFMNSVSFQRVGPNPRKLVETLSPDVWALSKFELLQLQQSTVSPKLLDPVY